MYATTKQIMTVLLYSGYLTCVESKGKDSEGSYNYLLKIPNKEIKLLLDIICKNWKY